MKVKLYPILCNYYVTTYCNARCSFCNIYKSPGKHAVIDDVIQNLNDLRKIGVRFIDFTGGEPLLYPHLQQALEHAKNLKLKTTVTTNTLLYRKYAERLKGKIDFLHFSLDGIDAATHNAIRGVPCYDSVMQSIDLAKSLNEKPDLLFTLTENNAHQLEDMVSLAQKHRLILIVNPEFNYFGNGQARNSMLQGALKVANASYVYINRAMVRFMLEGGNQRHNPRCRAVTTTLVIHPDNTLLLPCYHHHENVVPINGQLIQWWRSDQRKRIEKEQGRLQACQHCAISCYFDASFAHTFDRYFILSQMSKVKYAFDKYLRQ